jgi:hypothetical protein
LTEPPFGVNKIFLDIKSTNIMDREVAVSHKMKGMLDDDYTLFESGRILHEYDQHTYPGGQNLKAELTPGQINDEVKQRLLNSASEEDKELVKRLLEIK